MLTLRVASLPALAGKSAFFPIRRDFRLFWAATHASGSGDHRRPDWTKIFRPKLPRARRLGRKPEPQWEHSCVRMRKSSCFECVRAIVFVSFFSLSSRVDRG